MEVWESSVCGTHSFLSNDEILEIKEYVPSALKNVSYLIIYREKDNKLVAFMGIEENKLEMLFVDDKDRGEGIGKKMLLYGIDNYGVNELAVNEDKPQAKGFYEHFGFSVYQRNEFDD